MQADLDNDRFPAAPSSNIKTNDVAYMVINRDEACTVYTNLIGRFLCRSSRWNEYLLVTYHYDGNYIVDHPLKIERQIQ